MTDYFTLTEEERIVLESFKDHCKYTMRYIQELLNMKEIDEWCSEIDYIYADNARGIQLEADWNTMNGEIRVIKALYKRYEEWKDVL